MQQHENITIMAEEYCWRMIEGLAELHRAVNIATAIPYLIIGLELLAVASVVAYKNREAIKAVWNNRGFDAKTISLVLVTIFLILFGLFIFFCGGGHYFDYYVIDNATFLGFGAFWVSGYWKLATAIVSILTAFLLSIFLTVLAFSTTKLQTISVLVKIFFVPENRASDISIHVSQIEAKLDKTLRL